MDSPHRRCNRMAALTPFPRVRLAQRVQRVVLALFLAVAVAGGAAPGAQAARGAKEFAASLAPDEAQLFEDWLSAQTTHDFKTDAYWREVDNKRVARKKKKAAEQALAEADYVLTFPPVYQGPSLTPDLAKRWKEFSAKLAEEHPRPADKPKPGLADFLANARAQYDFAPEVIAEREFKLRYAREAMTLGLTKDQVVRIYALETSGLGTADMVAGIHPIKKTGTPISSAIGYAQLLAANSVSELVKSGPVFMDRLKRMAAHPSTTPERAAQLHAKIVALGKMTAAARSVPNKWDHHMSYARTAKGMGIHAVNLDGDIGPWLQVIKLQGLKDLADRRGMFNLKGAEIELMNLAGPATGLEMMRPVARNVPTTNFFERQAYGRNTIVRGKTASELLVALDERMNQNIGNAGAIEFADVFDQVALERQAQR